MFARITAYLQQALQRIFAPHECMECDNTLNEGGPSQYDMGLCPACYARLLAPQTTRK